MVDNIVGETQKIPRIKAPRGPEDAGRHFIQSALNRDFSEISKEWGVTCHISDWMIICPATMYSSVPEPFRSPKPSEMP